MTATLHTSMGDIRLNLFPNQAPKTVSNFVGLAEGTKKYGQNARGTSDGPFYDGYWAGNDFYFRMNDSQAYQRDDGRKFYMRREPDVATPKTD